MGGKRVFSSISFYSAEASHNISVRLVSKSNCNVKLRSRGTSLNLPAIDVMGIESETPTVHQETLTHPGLKRSERGVSRQYISMRFEAWLSLVACSVEDTESDGASPSPLFTLAPRHTDASCSFLRTCSSGEPTGHRGNDTCVSLKMSFDTQPRKMVTFLTVRVYMPSVAITGTLTHVQWPPPRYIADFVVESSIAEICGFSQSIFYAKIRITMY